MLLRVLGLICLFAAGSAGCAPSSGERVGSRGGFRALGYVDSSLSASDRIELSGVQRHVASRAYPGVNLRPTQDGLAAELFSMDGRLLHRWEPVDPFPELRRRLHAVEGWWEHVVLDAEGNLIGEADHNGLAKIGWNSELLWSLPLLAHHELELNELGEIYTFVSEPVFVDDERGDPVLLVDNPIAVVSPDGELLRTRSYLPLLLEVPQLRREIFRIVKRSDGIVEAEDLEPVLERLASPKQRRRAQVGELAYDWMRQESVLAGVRAMMRSGRFDGTHETFFALRTLGIADPLHANTLRILDAHPEGLWQRGDLLISLRSLDLVFVTDPQVTRIRWRWGPGEVYRQHTPIMLASGNVLVFDNGEQRSRVVEVDPGSGNIVWDYEADPPESFFSSQMGAVAPLPNGNLLVTSSMQGRVFEITRSGQVVWEWLTPSRGDRHEVVYRMERYDLEFVQPFLAPTETSTR